MDALTGGRCLNPSRFNSDNNIIRGTEAAASSITPSERPGGADHRPPTSPSSRVSESGLETCAKTQNCGRRIPSWPTTRARPPKPSSSSTNRPPLQKLLQEFHRSASAPTEQARDQRVVMAAPARGPWQRRNYERRLPPPDESASELKINLIHPVTAGAILPTTNPSSHASLPLKKRTARAEKQNRARGSLQPSSGNKRGVVPPGSQSKGTGGNVRGCRCWAFKIPEIE